MPLYYIDRMTGEKTLEKIEGDRCLKWLYGTQVGGTTLELIIKRKIPTVVYGKYQDTKHSRKKIKKMIMKHKMDSSEFEKEIISYTSFNDFFARKLKPEARPIDEANNVLISPADGRVLAYENIQMNEVIQVKGLTYTLSDLFQDNALSNKYQEGVCVIVRLSPVDYHRFHYPDSGKVIGQRQIKGHFYSVNPIALKEIIDLYVKNKREYTIFDSEHFGQIVMMEVGATCVGSIIQHHEKGFYARKGLEKGYFKFGGSTVMLFFEKEMVKIDSDIITNTLKGFETKVKMGEKIGLKIEPC